MTISCLLMRRSILRRVGNQNRLTDEHVEKIIDTYQRRQTVERYAYVASISEVKLLSTTTT